MSWRDWRNTKQQSKGGGNRRGGKAHRTEWDGAYTTITVQKPYCAPARQQILTALQPRGVIVADNDIDERMMATSPKDIAQRMKIEFRTLENIKYAGVGLATYLPYAIQADVRVRTSQAKWAEYCLAASGNFVILRGVDRKSAKAGYRRNGNLPTTTNGKETIAYVQAKTGTLRPQIEPGCSKGLKAWGDFDTLVKEAIKKEGKQ